MEYISFSSFYFVSHFIIKQVHLSHVYIKFKIIYNEIGDNMDINELSLREKIGQKFIFGINSNNIISIIKLIENYQIGGVILYKKNYNTYEEMLEVIKKLKKANSNNKIPLFIAIDQEGGRVNRMPPEFNNLKNVYDMSKKDVNLIYENGLITGKMLSMLGINMNFSPVIDINTENRSKALYKRCFYGDAKTIGSIGMKYVNGLKENNVIGVVKHFPGHGISKMDSHLITPYIFDYKQVLTKHIKPFEDTIKNGIDAIMVNHLIIRNLTKGYPASISNSFIQKYLREKNNFQGLVITDEINMLSKNIFYKFNYLKKAFLSGGDIILIKVKKRNSNIIDKMIKLVEQNEKYHSLVDDSVKRIIEIKEKYEINDEIIAEQGDLSKINDEIERINTLCL